MDKTATAPAPNRKSFCISRLFPPPFRVAPTVSVCSDNDVAAPSPLAVGPVDDDDEEDPFAVRVTAGGFRFSSSNSR